MFWFIIAILLALLALGCFIFIPFVKEVTTDEYSKETKNLRPVFAVAGGGLLLLAFFLFALGGLKSVPTKSIGIPVAFGRVDGTPYGPGLHETWKPWLGLAVIDETVQTTKFEVNQKTGQGGLDVRIGGQQTARLDLSIQWRVRPAAATGLFLSYANHGTDLMDEIKDAVVIRSLQTAANDVLGDYNPIVDVAVNSTSGNSQFSTFGPKLKAAMIHDIGGRIKVVAMNLPLAHYDQATQARLNNIQAQYAQTAIAKQLVQTNTQLAKANAVIRASVSNDPGVLVHECLQIVQEAEKTGYQLPAGFNCVGSATGVVLGK